jgi:hypothetical protein
MWPDRITATIRAPQMKTARDANVVVAAIAYARLGGDIPRVAADPPARSLHVRCESLTLSPRSIELAIACSGYAANTTPADLRRENGTPHGWHPVRL